MTLVLNIFSILKFEYLQFLPFGLIALFFLMSFLFMRKPKTGTALIRSGFGGTRITIGQGMLVIPGLHKSEIIDITAKKIFFHFKEKNALKFKENNFKEVTITFILKIQHDVESIYKAATTIGSKNVSNEEFLKEFFNDQLCNSIKTVSLKFDTSNLQSLSKEFSQEIIENIDNNLYGFSIEEIIMTNYKN